MHWLALHLMNDNKPLLRSYCIYIVAVHTHTCQGGQLSSNSDVASSVWCLAKPNLNSDGGFGPYCKNKDVSMQKWCFTVVQSCPYESPRSVLFPFKAPSDKWLWFDNLTLQQVAAHDSLPPVPLHDWIILRQGMLVILWHQCMVNSSSHAWEHTHRLSLSLIHTYTHPTKRYSLPCHGSLANNKTFCC